MIFNNNHNKKNNNKLLAIRINKTYFEISIIIIFIILMYILMNESISYLFSVDYCFARKHSDKCMFFSYRLKKFCQKLGDPLHVILSLMFIPIPKQLTIFNHSIFNNNATFEKIIQYHKFLARYILIVGSTIHGGFFFLKWLLVDGTLLNSLFNKPYNIYGLFALIISFVTLYFSQDKIRRTNYNLFKVTHIVAAPLYIIMLSLHYHGTADLWMKLFIPLLLIIIDLYNRYQKIYGFQLFENLKNKNNKYHAINSNNNNNHLSSVVASSSSSLSSSYIIEGPKCIGLHIIMLKISIPKQQYNNNNNRRADSFKYNAGEFVYLNIPSISKLIFKPFTLIPILVDDIDNNNDNNANNDEDDDVKFEILIKKSIYNKKRWSYNIENILSPSDNHLKNDENKQIILDGPYGGISLAFELKQYNSAYFVAGGIGITTILSHLVTMSFEMKPSSSGLALSNIKNWSFLWSVNDVELVNYCLPKLLKYNILSNIIIHVTRNDENDECNKLIDKFQSESKVNIISGRPDVKKYIQRFVKNNVVSTSTNNGKKEHIALVVCGPHSMMQAAKDSLYVTNKKEDIVHFHQEHFGW